MSKNMASHGSFYNFERNKCKSNWFCFPIFMVFRCLKMFMLLLCFLIYFQYFGSMMLKNCVALPSICMNQYRSCLYWFNGSPATAAGLTSFNNVFFLHSSLNSGFLSFSWGNEYKLTKLLVGETTGGGFETLRGDKTHCFISTTISLQTKQKLLKHTLSFSLSL